MKLRLRVTLTLFLFLIPSVFLFTFWRLGAEKRAIQSRMAAQVVSRFEERPPERCLRRPESFSIDRRGMRVFAYDPTLKSANPQAPPFPAALAGVLESQDPVHASLWRGPTDGATAAKILPDGPCAVVLVEWGPAPAAQGFLLPTIVQALAFALVLVLTGLVVSAPIVRRVRRLQNTVDAGEFEMDMLGWPDELGDLARALKASQTRVTETIGDLKARDESLSHYVANTTHDLAIPLTVLQHRLTRARDQIGRDSEAWKHVEIALEESHYIGALIRNMSLATKLERGEVAVTLHPTDLREVVERVFTRHVPVAEGKRIEFNLGLPEGSLVVACDSVMVEQAMSNLVQNAVQYTAEGGHVSVVLDGDSAGFEFAVLDDGPGIPEVLMEGVKTRGVRGDAARNRNAGGQGFGLSIMARVIDMHGWHFELTNTHPGLRACIST